MVQGELFMDRHKTEKEGMREREVLSCTQPQTWTGGQERCTQKRGEPLYNRALNNILRNSEKRKVSKDIRSCQSFLKMGVEP